MIEKNEWKKIIEDFRNIVNEKYGSIFDLTEIIKSSFKDSIHVDPLIERMLTTKSFKSDNTLIGKHTLKIKSTVLDQKYRLYTTQTFQKHTSFINLFTLIVSIIYSVAILSVNKDIDTYFSIFIGYIVVFVVVALTMKTDFG